MRPEKRTQRPSPDESPPGATHGRVERFSNPTTITLVVGLVVFLYFVRDILLPFAVAAIVAFVATPLVDWLAARTRAPRWVYALAVLFTIMGLGALLGLLGAPPLLRELQRVLGDLQGTVTTFVRVLVGDRRLDLMGQQLDAAGIGAMIAREAQSWMAENGRVLELAAVGVAGFFGGILTLVLLGYFLLDAHRIGSGLAWLIPPRYRPFTTRVGRDLEPILRRYFIGVGLVVLYASTAAYIGLGLVLKIQHAVFLALITGLLELIPFVGPAASAVLAGLVAVQQASSGWNIIAYCIYATALRISIDQFFGPLVLGRAAYVPPVLVIFCFLAGGLLFGIVGVMLSVPVALSVKVLLGVIYEEPDVHTS
ncbi:MAG TPA: AI-2E family transporter [Steroidobacteraceae bacterium]|nr:AI-2E family transporter [Steroidobacteraceae bacterium]